jgi:predicted alpha/beta-fold hydrolase
MSSLITLTNFGSLQLAGGSCGWTSPPAGASGLRGHWASIGGAAAAIFTRADRAAKPVEFEVPDERFGSVRLTGIYRRDGNDSLAVILHGLAGSAESHYCAAAASAASRARYDSLRLSMRGADSSGEDIYHAGLSADIGAVLADRRLSRYWRVVLIGYSFGGNLAIRAAIDGVDPRLAAVAAVCPPLDLRAVMEGCDSASRFLYKWAIKTGLNRCYARVDARGRAVTPYAVVARSRRCSDWDEAAIVPRFGFRGTRDYYERTSVIPGLAGLSVPCLVVAGVNDPIVPAQTVCWALGRGTPALSVRWGVGGHLSFPSNLNLGMADAPSGLEHQMFEWIRRNG